MHLGENTALTLLCIAIHDGICEARTFSQLKHKIQIRSLEWTETVKLQTIKYVNKGM